MARLTLWGMYQYEPNLFQGALLPPGLVKDTFIELLMESCGELYPHKQAVPQLRTSISIWFQAHLEEFDRIKKALEAEYSPIENYDRYEWSKRDYDNSGNDITNHSGSDTIRNSGDDRTVSTTQATATPNLTNTTEVSAYDASSYVPREQTHNTGNTVSEGNDSSTLTHGHVEATEYGKSETLTHGHQIDDEFKLHAHGNIGVTTNQQMITQELELRENNNIYDIIVRSFERKFLMRNY